MKATQRFIRLLSLDRKDISYIYLYAIFAGIITLSLPLGIQAIINLLTGGQASTSLYLLIGIITIGIALNGFLTVMQLTVTETLQRRIFTRSAFEFAFRIPRLRMEKVSDMYAPELINRFFDTLTIQKGIPKLLIDFSTAVLQIFFGLILLALYHPFFIAFGATLLVILFAIFYFTGGRGLRTSLVESKYKYKVAHWLEELGRAMNIFKLKGGSKLPISRTDELTVGYLNARKGHFRVLLFQYGAVVVFKTIITLSLLLLGSILVIENQISIGQFVAAEIIVILILNSVEKLILSMDTVYDVLTGLEKIGFVTDLPLERAGGADFNEITDQESISVELEDVTFQFDDATRPTLDSVSLKIPARERICLAGYNGSGKSTLLQLVSGIFSEYEGTITYNGIPQRALDLEQLRQEIGSLNTEDEIFNGTIIENITLGDERFSLRDVIVLARDLGLHDYINHLPEGYQTELVAGGKNVPRSVRTKIILCRTVIVRPHLMVLDHFMSRIERSDRARVMDYLFDPKHPWTLLAVSNEPDFAARCDRTVVLQNGEVLADGKFEDICQLEFVDELFARPNLP